MAVTGDVVVVIGAGGMGLACARRLGAGRRLLLADRPGSQLAAVAETLRREGFRVDTHSLDVTDRDAVMQFAVETAKAGPVRFLIHTAGRSPGSATAAEIYAVNLLGASHVMDAFLPLAAPGTVAVIIASVAAYLVSLPADVEARLALIATEELLAYVQSLEDADEPVRAYFIAKRANQLRVEAGAIAWGGNGARILSLSPGMISTPMYHVDKTLVPGFEQLALTTPVPRIGTPEDIAAAVEWLTSSQASFITGCDLRIDGGMVGLQRWGKHRR